MISPNSSLGVSAALGMTLINRGIELERRTGKATDRTTPQEEETGNEGTKDHKHAYEGSGG
jgi:hypothetical protein